MSSRQARSWILRSNVDDQGGKETVIFCRMEIELRMVRAEGRRVGGSDEDSRVSTRPERTSVKETCLDELAGVALLELPCNSLDLPLMYHEISDLSAFCERLMKDSE